MDAIEAELLTAKSKYESAPREATIGADQGLDQVLAGQARVDAAAANVAADKAELSKTIITSPIAGIVTRQDAKQGQIVSTGSTLISVISDQHLEIEANVSEVNISKVAVGNSVEVSFDSFPSLILKAKIVYVDPGEVLVGGVVNYKVTVEFDEVIPTTLKSGLTANLKILTARKDDVIKVPVYAVTKRSGVSYARVMVGDTIEERKVTTGLLGKDGTVEILTGISFGESVLIDASQTE